MRLGALSVAFSVLLPGLASPQAPISFADFKTFRCDLTEGEGRQVLEGKTFDRRGDGFAEAIMIDNVNYQARSARLIGNAGGDDLTVLSEGPLAVNFVEQTAPGGVIVLTIFKHTQGLERNHRAVMSRHLPITLPAGSVTTTQHYGTCRGFL